MMSQKRLPLAIVGIGCRMPGGIRTPDQLWQLISAGKDAVCEVPRDRWDWRRYYSDDRDVPGKIYVRSAAFLEEDIQQFDAEFFGISPREANSLDPQQRLLLETSWEAIDDAGLSLDRIAGSPTGVYIGGLTLDNMLTQMSSESAENIGPHSAASSTMTMLSNRLSYFLDLHGPSLSLDTACSSSLVAFHVACQALWNDECEMALVGAVNVMFRPEMMIAMCKGGFLAPDGRSRRSTIAPTAMAAARAPASLSARRCGRRCPAPTESTRWGGPRDATRTARRTASPSPMVKHKRT